jgi:hypothetical protein
MSTGVHVNCGLKVKGEKSLTRYVVLHSSEGALALYRVRPDNLMLR